MIVGLIISKTVLCVSEIDDDQLTTETNVLFDKAHWQSATPYQDGQILQKGDILTMIIFWLIPSEKIEEKKITCVTLKILLSLGNNGW